MKVPRMKWLTGGPSRDRCRLLSCPCAALAGTRAKLSAGLMSLAPSTASPKPRPHCFSISYQPPCRKFMSRSSSGRPIRSSPPMRPSPCLHPIHFHLAESHADSHSDTGPLSDTTAWPHLGGRRAPIFAHSAALCHREGHCARPVLRVYLDPVTSTRGAI